MKGKLLYLRGRKGHESEGKRMQQSRRQTKGQEYQESELVVDMSYKEREPSE